MQPSIVTVTLHSLLVTLSGTVARTAKKLAAPACAIFLIGCAFSLIACGGGGGGIPIHFPNFPNFEVRDDPPAPATVTAFVQPGAVYRLESEIAVATAAENLVTATSAAENNRRLFLLQNGALLAPVTGVVIITPGGTDNLDSRGAAYLRDVVRFTNPGSPSHNAGITSFLQRVYMVSFNQRCAGGVSFVSHHGSASEARHLHIDCLNTAGMTVADLTVHKAERYLHQVCWEDSLGGRCGLSYRAGSGRPEHEVFLAFPKQTYRREDGLCESAPFYAVDGCQRENSVDFGSFAAFVSGLDGGGYRQFGVRHRWEWGDWKFAGMISHAKGGEFFDTWWTKLRADKLLFGETRGFAEYESGVTSLRQNGYLFADLPISGGRFGFATEEFTASFGRPMHYKGKGKNSGALHWRANKETTFGLRRSNGKTDAQMEWRMRF